jgi:hypothetical protein
MLKYLKLRTSAPALVPVNTLLFRRRHQVAVVSGAAALEDRHAGTRLRHRGGSGVRRLLQTP